MRSRPLRAGLAGLAASALLLAACGDSERDESASSNSSPAASTSSSGASSSAVDAFPITIEHALGRTTIAAKPDKVVTVGWSSADTAVALGVVPVAVPTDSWAGDADGYLPWLRDAVEHSGKKLPTTYVDMPELDIDAVINADPDLIIAAYSGIDQDLYGQLSRIAPTVAYPERPWLTNWEELTVLVAKALGQEPRGKELVTEAKELLAKTAADNPDFKGKSFAYVFAGEGNQLSVYLPGDGRIDILSALGFEVPALVKGLTPAPGSFTATMSLEQADQLNGVDVLFTWFNDEAEKQRLESNPLFAQIPAVAAGRYVPLLDRQISMATSAVSPLSLPWVLDQWVPAIRAAVAG